MVAYSTWWRLCFQSLDLESSDWVAETHNTHFMALTYSQIKTSAIALYGTWIGSGGLIESDSGTPTTLALYLDFVHGTIAGFSQDWDFLQETGTITLTGASSYNLATLFPDLLSVYQIYGINENSEETFVSNSQANISPAPAYTIRGNLLVFSGSAPTSGTLRIQYKSQYMVKDSSGTRKQFFEDDTDVSVIPFAHKNVLIFGLGEFVTWKTDEQSESFKKRIETWSASAFNKLLLHPTMSRQVLSML